MSETVLLNGESVEMTEAERAQLGLTPPAEAPAAFASALTIRIFRSRFAQTDEDVALYDDLDARMEAERSRLVKQQWRDPGAEITEGAVLYNAIASHLDALVTPERKTELLARP